ncbi:hypothetical protein BKA70DRAFT_439528 [Coprinopsis sp. MPI-PUGE-AT-0042]|nr:hypothetical protein BKA70DRAFT_439528 [Coprinopsis sp. MPI-PUGE-AT-0042]
MSRAVAATLAAASPPSLQESIKNSTTQWQADLQSLFKDAKERFPDVVWELSNEEEGMMVDDDDTRGFMGIGAGGGGFDVSHVNGYGSSHGHGEDEDRRKTIMANRKADEVWGHKAIVYARAPPSFQSRYFRVNGISASPSPLPYSSEDFHGTSEDHGDDDPRYRAESSLSLGASLHHEVGSIRTPSPSPYRTATPTSMHPSNQQQQQQSLSSLLRISTSINSALFSNELEYLYTGQGFGEAFEFLFDSSEHAGFMMDGTREGSRESASELGIDAEELRIDKLRKDLVFMWRSRLYSDVRIALTGNFSSSSGTHENTTAIFSSHRFMLASRSPYFHDALLGSFSKALTQGTNGEPPTLTLPSPPFTPASLHFTLGFVYTGTLIFSHRTFDLSTAFAILRSSAYLSLQSLTDEIQARIAHEMLHGLFHAFLPFAEYEKLTQGRWGVGGCRCRQCARRVPRVLEFSLQEDVKNVHLERGSRRALVGLFGEGWCTSEFASLNPKLRDSLLKGLSKRTTPVNVWALLWAAEHALAKLGPVIEPWGDTVRENIFSARKGIDELLCKESEECFARDEWMEIMESDGLGFEDGEKVEWAMNAVLRGVKEPWAANVYQTLVSSILLRPHPNEENAPLLSATSPIRTTVESTRLELLRWIGKRWIGIRQEGGFDALEGWALKEISDHIEVPLEDLFNPNPKPSSSAPRSNSPNLHHNASARSKHLRPVSQHPHTSRIDADSDAASSMRVSLLTRNTGTPSSNRPTRTREGGSSASYTSSLTPSLSQRRKGTESVTSSVRSSVSTRSTATYESASTVGASRRRERTTTGLSSASVSSSVLSRSVAPSSVTSSQTGGDDEVDSPAKQIAASTRTRMKEAEKRERERERPDSKLTPQDADLARAAAEYDDDLPGHDEEDDGSDKADDGKDDDEEDAASDSTAGTTARGGQAMGGKGKEVAGRRSPAVSRRTTLSNASLSAPGKKTLVARASLASVTSRGTTSTTNRPRSSASSIRSVQTNSGARKASGGSAVSSSINKSPINTRPNSRGSVRTNATTATSQSRTTASSRTTLSGVSTTSRSTLSSRPNSRLSTTSTNTTGAGRPMSAVSTNSSTTESTDMTFRTASAGGSLGTPTTPVVASGLSPGGLPRSRKTSAASTVSTASASTTKSVAIPARGRKTSAPTGGTVVSGAATPRVRKVSASSISSVASNARSPVGRREKAPPVPPLDPTKLAPGGPTKRTPVSPVSPTVSSSKPKPSTTTLRSKASMTSLAGKKSTVGGVTQVKKTTSSPAAPLPKLTVPETKKPASTPSSTASSPARTANEDLPSSPTVSLKSLASTATTETTSTSKTDAEHKKTTSSASASSVATMRKRGSVDTITSRKTSKSNESQLPPSQQSTVRERVTSPPLPALPLFEEPPPADYTPTGATLDIGIPCIVSCKRKRFKAYARYIGEVHGELGPWVGVEVPIPAWEGSGSGFGGSTFITSTSNGMNASMLAGEEGDDRQWNDGSWCGVRYFEISNHGSDGWGSDDRAVRRRRIDGGSVGGAVWGHTPSSSIFGKSTLKREGDSLTVGYERMKKMRSASPTMSESSSLVESRGLFVRPQQVLYVVDAVGADL